MSIDDTTVITPGGGTTGGNLGELTPNQNNAWSNNPENISIGEGDTSTFRFTYNSPGNNQEIYISTAENDIIESVTWTEGLLENVSPPVYQASVTVTGAKKGGGEVILTIKTYTTTVMVEETTTIKVEAATPAKQIKFFDTEKNQLADNKLIAPKYIYEIDQNKTDPSQGTKASNSTKCLKTTNNTEYVKFTYNTDDGQQLITVTDYSRVSLSDVFSINGINAMQSNNRICLKGIINNPSRNITKDMLLEKGDSRSGFTYWCIGEHHESIT